MSQILLVDDDDGVRSILYEMLLEAGYEVCQADGAKAGRAILDAPNDVELVISDHNMPGEKGLDFLRYAQQLGKKTILISGDAPGGRDEAISLLKKPIGYSDLSNAVREALQLTTA